MSFLSKMLMGDPNARAIKALQVLVDKVNSFEEITSKLSDLELKNKTEEFRKRLEAQETLDDLMPEAFAVVREASKRTTGMRHYDVQLVGGAVLHRGQISEMRTGEGKTLVATLPVYLNALSGKGVHLVTVNDYLAKRDAVWMGQIYDFLGMSVAIIQNQGVSFKYVNPGDSEDNKEEVEGMIDVEDKFLEKMERKDAYKCDIVYGTNNEFGFDYLRDNMVQDLEDRVQTEFSYAIVDEVDSILIDEARTPLIISAPAEEATDRYYRFAELVARLKENEDYNIDEKMRSSTLTDAGIKKMEDWLGIENIYAEGGVREVHHVEQALKAYALFKRDKDYVVEDGEVVIVDEFTGRKMPGRRYSEGLHQAIEAKEKVDIKRESRTMATITFQNYFRMYDKLSGMTGTAVTEAEEFGKIYNLEVVAIPTNKPNQRNDQSDKIYKTEEAKNNAIVEKVKELQKEGRPVLIGTVSVEKNEMLGLFLEKEGVEHEVLNAKNHEKESQIIAQAGQPGRVTLATNMAGRGVDIILGGNPISKDLAEKVKNSGGLFVLGTERHESRRIDNQLRGRAGRQGDPGETQFFLSTEDDLMRIFAGDRIRGVMQTLRVPDDMPIEQRSISKLIESAQKKVEGFHFDSRKHLLEYDDVLNRHREVIYGKRTEILEIYKKQKEDEEKEDLLKNKIFEIIEAELEQLVSFHTNAEEKEDWNLQEIYETVVTIFPVDSKEKEEIFKFKNPHEGKFDDVVERTKLIEYLTEISRKKYQEILVDKIGDQTMMIEIEKQILLRSIDTLWIDHLVNIDYLRAGIGLRGYGQRDPLVEYKKETYNMFNQLLSSVQNEVVYSIYKVGIGLQMAPSAMQTANLTMKGAQKTSKENVVSATPSKLKNSDGEKVGRNDLCPCGSGKKYKRCHGE